MTHRNRLAAATLDLLVLLSLPGCMSLHSYPQTWETASPARADGCPDINGTYANAGENASGSRNGVTLSTWLLPSGRGPYMTFDRVALELSADELAIRASGPDGSRSRILSRSRDEYDCRDGALTLTFTESCCFDNVSTHTAGTLSITRTPSFVVLGYSDVGAGIVIFLPVVFAQHGYARFEPFRAATP